MQYIAKSAASNELHSVNTTCAYCGVGCGIQATVNVERREVLVQGDDSHPSSQGRLCSKGASLGDTLSLQSRLLYPQVNGQRVSWDEAIDTLGSRFQKIIQQHGPDAVAFYGSGQLLTEDYYVANKLMKGFIGSANIDTNSRLCMSSAVAGHKRAFGSDTVPTCYDDIDHANLIVLVGSNTAWCHPIIFQRIRAAKERNPDMKVVVIDPRETATCDIADLHLALRSTTDVALFNGLLVHLAQGDALDQEFIGDRTIGFFDALEAAKRDMPDIAAVSACTELDHEKVKQFYQWFLNEPRSLTLYSQGVKQSSSGVDKVNAILNCHLATGRIGKPGMGPLSLTGQPNAMGGREVGGLANQLAAHMEITDDTHRDRVARFWQTSSLADKPGLAAVDLFEAIAAGRIKAIWIMATNPVVSMPDADRVKEALKKCELVVVSDCVANTDTLDLADIKLPAQGWSEKDGMVTNSERYISHQRALLPPAGEAKPDWWIISRVAQRMGYGHAFDYQHQVEIFREHAALSGFENNSGFGERDFDISGLAEISLADYQAFKPTQWPINKTYPAGRKRMFEDQLFYTTDRKARFIALSYQKPKNVTDAQYPLVLNTGRLRDQWHTMTRSALAPRLNQHRPEPFVEVHPEDAVVHGLEDGEIAHLRSAWGQMYARINVRDTQRKGDVFVPMHWSEQYAKKGRMGALVNPVVDALSGQPESKHTPVAIRPFHAAWHGFLMTRVSVEDLALAYQVKVVAEDYYRYELAAIKTPRDWLTWLKDKLHGQLKDDMEWQQYHDAGAGVFRVAVYQHARLMLVFCASSTASEPMLPSRNWLGSLFMRPEITAFERRSVLAGMASGSQEDQGVTVCACYGVGEKAICRLIEEQSLSCYQQVGASCKAGTNCGSCIPEIKSLISQVRKKETAD